MMFLFLHMINLTVLSSGVKFRPVLKHCWEDRIILITKQIQFSTSINKILGSVVTRSKNLQK